METNTPSVKIRLKKHTLEQIASIPEARPYKSILTNAPKADLRLPLVFAKVTKAFFFITFLSLFVDRSIAHGLWDYGYPPPLRRLDGSSSNMTDNQNNNLDTRDERRTLKEPHSTSTSTTTPNRDTPFVSHRASAKLTKKAKEALLNGIAQDIFFHPMELNFYEAKWPEFFSEWASESQSRYNDAIQTRQGLSKFTFFAEDVLDWEGFDCSIQLRGCQKMPTPEMVRKHFSTDRFKARQVIYTLDSFRKLHTEIATYADALIYATETVSSYCRTFSETFFHGETKGYKKMCTAQIVQIIMGVITAIIAVATIGQALYALAPVMAAGISSIVASGAAAAVEVGAELGLDGVIELGVDAGVDAAVQAAAQVATDAVVSEGVAQGLIQGIDIPSWAVDTFLETNQFVWPTFDYVNPLVAEYEVVAGPSTGVVGETAVADTAGSIFDSISVADSFADEISMASEQFEGFMQGTGFTQAEWNMVQKQAIGFVKGLVRGGLNPWQFPRWIQSKVTGSLFTRILQTATSTVKQLTSASYMKKALLYMAARTLRSEVLAEAARAGLGIPFAAIESTAYDEDLYQSLTNVTENALLDIMISYAGEQANVADIPTFVAQEKQKLLEKRYALRAHMDIAMSSFTKSKNDKSPLPKVWGSFGVVEWFPIESLVDGEDSVYDQASVESRLFFKQYPKSLQLLGKNGTSPYDKSQTNVTDTWVNPSYLRQDGNATESDWNTNVLRISKLFTMYELEAPKKSLPNVDSPWSLGPRIVWRMQDQNGVGMLASDAMKFWEENSDEIHRRVQLLRQIDYQSDHVPLTKPVGFVQAENGLIESGIRIGVNTALDTLPWTSILGSIQFTGYGSTNDGLGGNSPELRWEAKSNFHESSRLTKRDAQMYMERVARHDIRGKINTLQSLGLIDSAGPHWKRQDGGVPIQQESTADGSIFIAKVNDHLFKNDIHHELCGLDHYTGNTEQNESNCYTFLNMINDQITQELLGSLRFDGSDLETFTMAVSGRFSSYTSFLEADSLAVDKSGLKEKLTKNLQNNLVSKAYADENCFLQCAPNYQGLSCSAGCFDPVGMHFERLYGFTGFQYATWEPWRLSEEKINRVSLEAYQKGSMEGYLPGRIDLNPYSHSFKDQSPILPVCVSQFGLNSRGLLCNCGNNYGDETDNVVAAENWKSSTKNNEYDAINSCLQSLAPLAQHSPAAFLVNMCRVFFRQFVPPGTGSYQEIHDKGDYGRNRLACDKYLDHYERNKYQSDEYLNDSMCRLWNREGKNFKKDGFHPDFSYVNSMLRKGGCDPYH